MLGVLYHVPKKKKNKCENALILYNTCEVQSSVVKLLQSGLTNFMDKYDLYKSTEALSEVL